MKIKKIIAAACALSLSACVFASCTDGETSSSAAESSSSAAETSSAAEESSSETESAVDSSSLAEDSSSLAEVENKQTSDITPAMWVITSESGTEITMLGSMHALKDEDYPLPDKIMDAYNGADILAVECDTTETQSLEYQVALTKEMVLEEGDSLKDHLSEEGYDILSEYLSTYGYKIEMFNGYKPWAVSSTVDSLSLLSSGLSTDLGIDYYFMEQAHESGKEIYEVESVDFQMDMLMNFSDDIYDLMFRCLEGEDKESQTELLMDMYKAWRTGDVDTIDKLNNQVDDEDGELSDEDMALTEEYMDKMIYDRNITMENSVKELLKGDKDVFFVVGAAHFTGEGGIIDLLEKDGYTVERIEY